MTRKKRILIILGLVAVAACWVAVRRRSEPPRTPVGLAFGDVAGTTKGNLAFSPDGAYVSYLQEDRLEELALHGRIWSRTISLHWCRASEPGAVSSTAIETFGAEFKGYAEVPGLQVRWSPTGSRIGVLTPNKLVLVDVRSGGKIEVGDGRLMGFGWPSDGELAYCSIRTRGGMQRNVVCRQDLAGERRTEIVAFPEYPATDSELDSSWQTHWSPSGKYVIFLEPSHRGPYHCVNVLDGTSRTFGQSKVSDEGVAWAPDSGHAFCVSRKIGPEDAYEAILFEPATGKLIDCSSDFKQTFGEASPVLEPVWTPDGKYFLANHVYRGGFLVQPAPWEVIRVGKIAATKLPNARRPWLFSLPVAGWVGVLPTGNIGDSPIKYAADYSGEQIHPLGELGDSWSFSPDGATVATLANESVTVRALDKWWLARTTTSATSR